MRSIRVGAVAIGFILAGAAGAQSLTEYGAAAAGGAVGGAAGKKVSEGISTIFGKVDQQTKAAAKTDAVKPVPPPPPPDATGATASPAPAAPSGVSTPGPALSTPGPAPAPSAPVAPPQPKTSKPAVAKVARATKPARELPPNVPDPPPLPGHVAAAKPPERPVAKTEVLPPSPVTAPVPVPEVTPADLGHVARGAGREEVLKLGVPAERITMVGDDGHLLEIYSYMTKGVTFGVLRLRDGEVSQVELR